MRFAKVAALLFINTLTIQFTNAQIRDSSNQIHLLADTTAQKRNWKNIPVQPSLNFRTVLIPAALIAYGVTSIESDQFKALNEEIKEELVVESPHKKFTLDNYLQFAPAAAVYGLNAIGIKGKNNFRDRSMIYLLSNIIVTGTVFSVKNMSRQLRPDGSSYSSFPSGHTAEAFASAEFMRQEYKNVSPWYGVAGYAMAATTGYLRMYNNKHWLSDVVAGAGIGIASTKIAYWLYPKIQRILFKDKPVNTMVLPSYQNNILGVGLVHRF